LSSTRLIISAAGYDAIIRPIIVLSKVAAGNTLRRHSGSRRSEPIPFS